MQSTHYVHTTRLQHKQVDKTVRCTDYVQTEHEIMRNGILDSCIKEHTKHSHIFHISHVKFVANNL